MISVPRQAPNPPPQAPPGLDALADQVIGWLKWGVLVAGMMGLLVCAGMIIVGRRRRGGLAQEGLIGSLWVLGGLALASAAALLVGVFGSVGAR
ncbi:hypothetical protein GCM10023321_44510 [Pseudonocardia eucalypti]|uniref:DUF4190 domain-containing protein n=1 Tax=Pseudonocardia eucalypti TaxID=648755 RepID=A0ABP9QF95_9PSEU|nr:hypothetical protein [Pseudonocardia eucalypti]